MPASIFPIEMISLLNGNNNNGAVLASGELAIVLSAIGSGTIHADFDKVRLKKAPVVFNAPAFGVPRVSGGIMYSR